MLGPGGSQIARIAVSGFIAGDQRMTDLFRQVSDVTLWGYITDKRIGAAIQLLTDKHCNASMLEIATRCGFNNTANFNKAFRKATGSTPSQYRKLYDPPL